MNNYDLLEIDGVKQHFESMSTDALREHCFIHVKRMVPPPTREKLLTIAIGDCLEQRKQDLVRQGLI